MSQTPQLTTLRDALIAALSDTRPGSETEMVPLHEAFGRVLAKPLIARFDTPPSDNSAMDGYAVRHGDLSTDQTVRLQVIGAALAGHPFNQSVLRGTAVRIATGAPMPDGVDTVVMQENVAAGSEEEGFIDISPEIAGQTRIGRDIRLRGEDVFAGDEILMPGRRLRPQDVSLAGGQGLAEICVYRRPRVAVYATGDELAAPGQELKPGQIYESNRLAMIGLLKEIGCEVTDLGLVADKFDVLQQALSRAAVDHDVIITSGGVSVGKADLLKPVVDSLGTIDAWRMAIKPGKPVMRGRIGNCLIIGLPGNPVSTMVTLMLYARPILLKMGGAKDLEPVRLPVKAGFSWRRKPGRREFLRARLETTAEGDMVAQVYHATGSHMIRSMVWAEGLVELPEDQIEVSRGDVVTYLPFSDN